MCSISLDCLSQLTSCPGSQSSQTGIGGSAMSGLLLSSGVGDNSGKGKGESLYGKTERYGTLFNKKKYEIFCDLYGWTALLPTLLRL